MNMSLTLMIMMTPTSGAMIMVLQCTERHQTTTLIGIIMAKQTSYDPDDPEDVAAAEEGEVAGVAVEGLIAEDDVAEL